MKKIYLLILSFVSLFNLNAQKPNFITYRDFLGFEDFEIIDNDYIRQQNPFLYYSTIHFGRKSWFVDINKNCCIQKDSINVHSGKYSITIKPINSNSTYNFDLTHHFFEERLKGDSLIFNGWVKGENILLNDSIALYIYQANNTLKEIIIPINNKWQQFDLRIPNITSELNSDIGIRYQGRATIWFDNFSFSVDNKNLDELYPVTGFDLDHEFDASSKFKLPANLSPLTYNNLEILCKVWGFLKYYHPSIQKGIYDWNYELFRILPKIIKCKDNTSAQTILSQWIKGLKTATTEEYVVTNNDSILFYPDLEWINSQNLGNELSTQLDEIFKKSRSNYNYTVSLYHLGYPIFYEPLYEKISWNDDGYRLLCLFRYWNIINYFHPYRPYFENNWQKLLPTYIRLFSEVKDISDYEKAIFRLAAESKDSHTNIYSPSDYTHFNIGQIEPYQIPLETKVYKDGLIVTGYWFEETKQCGLELGDIITRINGKTIKEIRDKKDCFFSFSNENGMINTYPLLSIDQDTALVSYIRQGREKNIVIKDLFGYYGGTNSGVPIRQQPISSQQTITKDIVYINPMVIKSKILKHQLDSLKNFPNLILDLRGYPIDSSIDTVLANFLLPNEILYRFTSYADLSNPGMFKKNSIKYRIGHKNPDYYKGKVMLLVNEETISMSEIIALICSFAPNSKTIGSLTRGVLGNVSYIPFIANYGTRMTGIGVYYPTGECTYPNGIKLSHEIMVTPESINKGKGYLIDFAKEICTNEK